MKEGRGGRVSNRVADHFARLLSSSDFYTPFLLRTLSSRYLRSSFPRLLSFSIGRFLWFPYTSLSFNPSPFPVHFCFPLFADRNKKQRLKPQQSGHGELKDRDQYDLEALIFLSPHRRIPLARLGALDSNFGHGRGLYSLRTMYNSVPPPWKFVRSLFQSSSAAQFFGPRDFYESA